jgi:hypothetical protein
MFLAVATMMVALGLVRVLTAAYIGAPELRRSAWVWTSGAAAMALAHVV